MTDTVEPDSDALEQPDDGDVSDNDDGGDAADSDAAETISARELLQSALVDDQDPRFPRWLPLPGIVAALGWAAYDWAAADGAFLATLLWPGAAILVLVTIVTWFGWQLDID
jgi:hypothetical protein